MAIRAYLLPVTVLTMPGLPAHWGVVRGPVNRTVVPAARELEFIDGDPRTTATPAAQTGLVRLDVTDAEHTLLTATAGVTWLPFEDVNGAALSGNDPAHTVGTLAPARRTALPTALATAHVPSSDLTDATPLADVLGRVRQRLLLRQVAGPDDPTEPFTSPFWASPRAWAALGRMAVAGYDVRAIRRNAPAVQDVVVQRPVVQRPV